MSRRKATTRVELVETHNIALSIDRICSAPGGAFNAWKRALYHAICMSQASDYALLKRIREALELP